MRETAGLPAGILAYVVISFFILLLCQKIFVAPEDWARLITFMTSAISFELACAATEKFSTLTGVKIVALFIVAFQIIILGADLLGTFSDILETLEGVDNKTPADIFVEYVATVWNSKICAGVTIVLALWTVTK
ncbi:MAG: hypothetical protein IJ685_05285 [Selenomonadaceae bacterium]|nr:hypothetical protein [Selenomonadaceae bacterium]